MFVNFKRMHKAKIARLLTTGLVLCVVMLCWEDLDHHVVSHVRSTTYRYLINDYNFLNSSFAIKPSSSSSRSVGNLRNQYLINQPFKCMGKEDILLLLFVKSSPENADRRLVIRETWGNEDYIRANLDVNVKVMFALGEHPEQKERGKVQKLLDIESGSYRDLIQQDFMDTFHNLTSKLILQFKWASEYCPKAKFVMSTDDDVFVHVPNLVRYLRRMQQKQVSNFWVGHVHRGSPPVRRKTNKYYVPFELYPWSAYPDYTSGAGYVVSRDVVFKIHRATKVLNSSLYIDDVFMGICADSMGVSPQDYAYFAGEAKTAYHPCVYERMITSHGHTEDMRTLWERATDPDVQNVSKGFLSSLYCTAMKVALLCLPHFQDTYQCKAAFT